MATCGARTKSCRKCGHRYTKDEYDLWACPECGEDRHCKIPVAHKGDRCRFHGGKSPKGIASPHFKHGRLSKYMPDKLAARYDEALSDDDLMALRNEIALLDARLAELLETIHTGESGPAWGQLRDLHKDMKDALVQGDPQTIAERLKDMDELIDIGVRRGAMWQEIYDVAERMGRLKQTEHKRLQAMHQMITVERAMAMVARMTQVVVNNVDDPDTKLAIVSELRELTLRGDR